MRIKTFTLALASLALSASSALALTFDFTTLPTVTLTSTQTYTSGGETITVEAASSGFNTRVAQKNSPGPYYRGLGVEHRTSKVGSVDDQEMLDFTIPSGYHVSQVTLSRRGDTDQTFDILVDNMVAGAGTLSSANTSSVDGRQTFNVNSMGSMFSIRAQDGSSGGVWVNSLQLTADNMATMPLPGGVVLLGGALVAGGFAARRKAKRG